MNRREFVKSCVMGAMLGPGVVQALPRPGSEIDGSAQGGQPYWVKAFRRAISELKALYPDGQITIFVSPDVARQIMDIYGANVAEYVWERTPWAERAMLLHGCLVRTRTDIRPDDIYFDVRHDFINSWISRYTFSVHDPVLQLESWTIDASRG